jgi:2-polyprenyl-3-methyl-5-hydroxy-6-metoxy-1,4-benzoquinol methylase
MLELNMTSNYYGWERQEILNFLPTTFNSLLDIGCSKGGFGAAVKAKVPQAVVWGIEPVAAAAEIASHRLDKVYPSLLSADLDLPLASFDVITMNDSLEHMPDERAALSIVHSLLRPGGRLICSIPNVRYIENIKMLLQDAEWKYTDSGVMDHTHLRFFTRKSIERTILAAGFNVVTVRGINSHWWTGWKIGLLRAVFGDRIEDMRWLQFVVVAETRQIDC